MVFPHSSSGYRDARARDQDARLSKAPLPLPANDPLPWEVDPSGRGGQSILDAIKKGSPSKPPAIVTPPNAPFGYEATFTPGGLVKGLGVGAFVFGLDNLFDVTGLINDWKRANYGRSSPYDRYGYMPYDESKEYEVQFDFEEDFRIQERHRRLAELYVQSEAVVPSDFYGPDDLHGPVFTRGNTRTYWKYVNSCPSNPPSDRWHVGTGHIGPGVCTPNVEGISHWNSFGVSNCSGLGNVGSNQSAPLFVCPTNPEYWHTGVGGYTDPAGAVNYLPKEVFLLRQLTGGAIPAGMIKNYPSGYGRVVTTLDLSAEADPYQLGHGTPWRDAVASPGSQPSLAEQLAGQKLPSGKAKRGYYVHVPLNYPFMMVSVEPGSPPVAPPDVVIDPSTGTVTITPPSPPEYPSPEAGEFERKPRNPLRGVGAFINVATEAQDFLEAMHKGLPKKYRTKGRWGIVPDGDIILLDIINHWDEWDAEVALEAFVNNQIEDYLLGKYYFGQISKRTKSPFGNRLAGQGAGAIPIPQVHFANGQHSISVGDVEIELVGR